MTIITGDILDTIIGCVIFWGTYFLYNFLNEKYYNKKRAEWDKEIKKEVEQLWQKYRTYEIK